MLFKIEESHSTKHIPKEQWIDYAKSSLLQSLGTKVATLSHVKEIEVEKYQEIILEAEIHAYSTEQIDGIRETLKAASDPSNYPVWVLANDIAKQLGLIE